MQQYEDESPMLEVRHALHGLMAVMSVPADFEVPPVGVTMMVGDLGELFVSAVDRHVQAQPWRKKATNDQELIVVWVR